MTKYKLEIPKVIDPYWAGFILGDGCIIRNIKKDRLIGVALGLHSQDIEHIKKFANYLKTDKPIIRIPPNESTDDSGARLTITNKELAELFVSSGIPPNKSRIAKVPPQWQNDRNFWRGIIDADGTIGIVENLPYMALYGTFDVISSFIEFSKFVFGPKFTKRKPTTNRSIYKVAFTKQACLTFLKYLYCDGDLALDRKLNIVKNLHNTFHISSTHNKVVVSNGPILKVSL